MASATLPSIPAARPPDADEFRKTLSHSLGMVFLLTLPSSVGLVVLGKSIIGAIYQAANSISTTRSRLLWRFVLRHRPDRLRCSEVLTPAFYALGDARTPMLVSLASILINYAAADT